MTIDPADHPSHLSVRRALVVQCGADTAVEQACLAGRVEQRRLGPGHRLAVAGDTADGEKRDWDSPTHLYGPLHALFPADRAEIRV
jgi:hypothetical protein